MSKGWESFECVFWGEKAYVAINRQMAGPHLIMDQRVSGQAMNQVFDH